MEIRHPVDINFEVSAAFALVSEPVMAFRGASNVIWNVAGMDARKALWAVETIEAHSFTPGFLLRQTRDLLD